MLFTVRELHHGGIERDVAKIAMHLDRTRWEPHVASFHATGMRYDELRAAGVPYLHIPLTSIASKMALSSALRMRRYIREHGIVLMHAWDNSATFSVPVARAAGVRVALKSQLSYRSLTDPHSRRMVRLTDRLVHGIVVNCEAMRRHLVDDERYPADRIALCYNGVDTVQFFPRAEPRMEALADASLVIGTLCVLRPEKALDLVQEAFARVRRLKPGMKLMMVGSGPELPRLKANAKRLGIEDSNLFFPTTPEVPRFLRSMDIFVLSSKSEAFSNSLLEAIACGCCGVGSRVGGTPEMLGENERGLLFRSGDAGDLEACLERLIRNDELRRELASRGAEFARTQLSIERACESIGAIYEQWLGLRGGSG